MKVRDAVNPRRLLVFDTDPALHELLATVLQREGRSIQDAYDRHEALEALRHSDCDLVLAGQGRNGDEGVKLLRRMRSIRPDARVILAGGRDPAGALAAIRGHAYAYFHKPIPAGPLADMVQLALDATTWRDDIRVASARPEWITLEVRCKLEAAERTTQFIREMLADLEPQTAEDIAAAFRELLINAIEHGGKSDAHKRVRASLLRTSHAVMTASDSVFPIVLRLLTFLRETIRSRSSMLAFQLIGFFCCSSLGTAFDITRSEKVIPCLATVKVLPIFWAVNNKLQMARCWRGLVWLRQFRNRD